MITLSFFNHRSGVGKTALTYHIAHMLQRLGLRVLAVDLDPQAGLTSTCLSEEDLEVLWREQGSPLPDESSDVRGLRANATVVSAVNPWLERHDEHNAQAPFEPIELRNGLWLVAGDLELSRFETMFANAWSKGDRSDPPAPRRSADAGHNDAWHTVGVLRRMVHGIAEQVEADVVVVDVGPNLTALNRTALSAVDNIVIPVPTDVSCLRSLRTLGPELTRWRTTLERYPSIVDAAADTNRLGTFKALGYLTMEEPLRLYGPGDAYQWWMDRIPGIYREYVQGQDAVDSVERHQIAKVRNYLSLAALSRDAHKPMFELRAADGAIGTTQQYVQRCYWEFKALAEELLARLDTNISDRRVPESH